MRTDKLGYNYELFILLPILRHSSTTQLRLLRLGLGSSKLPRHQSMHALQHSI